MARILGVTSFLVFSASLLVHLATFLPWIPVSMDFVWPLHLATMATGGIMAVNLMLLHQRLPKPVAEGFFAKQRASSEQYKAFQAKMHTFVPAWQRYLCAAAGLYVILNFGLFMYHSTGGSPIAEDGKFFLHNHGEKIRELTLHEYNRLQAYLVRGLSGHWLVFSLMPTVYFLTIHPRRDELVAPNAEQSG